MFENLIHNIALGIATMQLLISSFIHPITPIIQPVENQAQNQQVVQQQNDLSLGANVTNPVGGNVYTLAGSGVSGSATSITLTSLTIPQTGYEVLDADLSDTFYITFEPGSRTRQEFASCTTVTQNANNTATLSGCVRGLLPFSPYTASSTYQFAHGGGTSVVFSNPPQFYEEFAAKGNAASINGVWTFNPSFLPRVSSTPTYTSGDELKFVTYGQLASTSFSGTVDGSETQKGIFEAATQSELPLGSATGSTGAILVPQNKYFNATSSATTTVPVTKTNGKLSQGFIDLSESFAFTGANTYATTTIFNGSSTFNNPATFASSTTFSAVPSIPGYGKLLDATTTTQSVLSTAATTTILNVAIPANTLSTVATRINGLQATLFFTNLIASAGQTVLIEAKYGGTTFASTTLTGGFGGAQDAGKLDIVLLSNASSTSESGFMNLNLTNALNGSFAPANSSSTFSKSTIGVSNTSSQNFAVTVKNSNSGASDGLISQGYTVILFP